MNYEYSILVWHNNNRNQTKSFPLQLVCLIILIHLDPFIVTVLCTQSLYFDCSMLQNLCSLMTVFYLNRVDVALHQEERKDGGIKSHVIRIPIPELSHLQLVSTLLFLPLNPHTKRNVCLFAWVIVNRTFHYEFLKWPFPATTRAHV